MNQIIHAILLALATGFAAAACGGAAEEGETKTAAEPQISYPQAEQGATTEVGVEGYFQIALDDDTSGELRWLFKEPPDDALLKIIKEDFDGPAADPEGGGGGPGSRTWLFQAIAAGETEITIEYLRPWEDGVPPAKTATYKIVVKEKPAEEPAEEPAEGE